jgi:hypothetical protein
MTLPAALAKMKERLDKATPGKWITGVDEDTTARTLVGPFKTNKYNEYKSGIIVAQAYAPTLGEGECNAELIAHCPTDLAKLIQVVEILSEAMSKIESGYLPDGSEVDSSTYIYAEKALTQAEKVLAE